MAVTYATTAPPRQYLIEYIEYIYRNKFARCYHLFCFLSIFHCVYIVKTKIPNFTFMAESPQRNTQLVYKTINNPRIFILNADIMSIYLFSST